MPTLITFEYPPDVRSIPFTTPLHPSVECGMEGLHSTHRVFFGLWVLEARGSRREPRGGEEGEWREPRMDERKAVWWGGGAFAGARERLREGVRFRNGKANHGKKRMTTLGVSALIWIATIRIF